MNNWSVINRLKLSELSDGVEVSIEESSTVYTVAELKREIIELGKERHLSEKWWVVRRRRWTPSASSMLETYIERESDEMYEGWQERVNGCITDEVVSRIQAILDESFKSDYATSYFTYVDRVEIDIVPPKN